MLVKAVTILSIFQWKKHEYLFLKNPHIVQLRWEEVGSFGWYRQHVQQAQAEQSGGGSLYSCYVFPGSPCWESLEAMIP